jgi:cell division protein FtsB
VTATATAAPTRASPSQREGLHPLLRLGSRVLLPALLAVAVLVVLVYAVFPTRAWLDQGAEITDLETELIEIQAHNDVLEARVGLLNTLEEIERIARRDHGLVLPGEEAYAVLPAAPAPVRLPVSWPFTELADALD